MWFLRQIVRQVVVGLCEALLYGVVELVVAYVDSRL
jgi:hypothetical protein